MRNYISVRQTVVTRWYLNPVTTVVYLFLILLSLTLQAFRIQQEIINIDCQNTIFIIIWLHNIFCNDKFLKRVINLPERSDFLRPLCFIRKRICRLNVISGRTREDIQEVRKIVEDRGSKIKIIAKIENMQGIQNLEEIINVADGIMVARGDMGVEIPLEEVPILQKKMIKMAVAQGKHVITATQMLESMIKNPRPTRAEATDIANAIYDGTTAIMLSGESAAGLYPVEAVKTMSRIAERAEQDIDYRGRMQRVKEDRQETPDITTAISYATCSVASDLNAAAIITVTMSGFTANMIARYKPGCQIIGCTLDEKVYRQLNLLWGVKPVMIQKERTTDALFEEAVFKAKQAGLVKTGDTVVITAGVPLGVVGKTDMIHVVEVE